jgi:hypothetical protein
MTAANARVIRLTVTTLIASALAKLPANDMP